MPKPNTVRESDDDDDGGVGDASSGAPNVNCDNDGSSSDVIRNNSNPEIEISSLPCNDSDNTGGASDKPTTDTVNTLLAPIEQLHAESYTNSGAENESDGKCYFEGAKHTNFESKFSRQMQMLPVNDAHRRHHS